jgi:hypothetical protein
VRRWCSSFALTGCSRFVTPLPPWTYVSNPGDISASQLENENGSLVWEFTVT